MALLRESEETLSGDGDEGGDKRPSPSLVRAFRDAFEAFEEDAEAFASDEQKSDEEPTRDAARTQWAPAPAPPVGELSEANLRAHDHLSSNVLVGRRLPPCDFAALTRDFSGDERFALAVLGGFVAELEAAARRAGPSPQQPPREHASSPEGRAERSPRRRDGPRREARRRERGEPPRARRAVGARNGWRGSRGRRRRRRRCARGASSDASPTASPGRDASTLSTLRSEAPSARLRTLRATGRRRSRGGLGTAGRRRGARTARSTPGTRRETNGPSCSSGVRPTEPTRVLEAPPIRTDRDRDRARTPRSRARARIASSRRPSVRPRGCPRR